jgi:hypothetical protein
MLPSQRRFGNRTFQQSLMNWGLTTCQPVTTSFYNSSTCTGTPSFSITQSSGTCNGYSASTCLSTSNASVQSVTETLCWSPIMPNTTSTFQSGSCQPVWNARGYLWETITCSATTSYCTHINLFSASNCNTSSWQSEFRLVCGDCIDNGAGQYLRMNCDYAMQTSSLDTGCNAGCSVCQYPQNSTFALNSCSSLGQGSYAFSQGVVECATVDRATYNNSACTGAPQGRLRIAQQYCEGGEQATTYTCGNIPNFNTSILPQNPAFTQVLHTKCAPQPGQSLNTYCDGTNCKYFVHETGVCVPTGDNLRKSIRLTCQPKSSNCVEMYYFQSPTCDWDSNNIFILNLACNTCNFHNGKYLNAQCDPQGTVYIFGNCDSTCSNCTSRFGPGNQRPISVRPVGKCVPSGFSPTTWVWNTGARVCDTVTVTEFTSDTCDMTTVSSRFTTASGECNSGESWRCGAFSDGFSQENNVTERQCRANTNKKTYATSFCVNQSTATNNFSYAVGCLDEKHVCARGYYYYDPACTNFKVSATTTCGSCNKDPITGLYYNIQCDKKQQTVTILTNCDATCTTCDPQSNFLRYLDACAPVNV